jgi:glycosyltransferase involved in cell wall biosynthesis
MNIVFLLRYIDSGGITRVIYDSSRFLLDKNCSVYIFYGAYLGDNNSFKSLLNSNPNLKFIQIEGLSLQSYSLFKLPFGIIYFLYKLKKYNINIVHLHWLSLSFVCVLSRLILKVPFITTVHLINKDSPSFFRFYSDCNISISTEISDWLINSEGVDRRRIYKIFNSVNPIEFPFISSKDRKKNKEKYGLASKFVLLSLSRFEQVKRLDIIVESLSRLREYDFVLFLCGEGKLFYEIKDMVNNLNLNDKVIFKGHVDPREVLSYADAIILSSDQEGFPMSIVESMISGVIPIRTDAEGAIDQIIDRENGFIFRKSNVDDLVMILEYIFKNLDSLEGFSNNAHEFALTHFNFVKNQNEILNLYKKVISLN